MFAPGNPGKIRFIDYHRWKSHFSSNLRSRTTVFSKNSGNSNNILSCHISRIDHTEKLGLMRYRSAHSIGFRGLFQVLTPFFGYRGPIRWKRMAP